MTEGRAEVQRVSFCQKASSDLSPPQWHHTNGLQHRSCRGRRWLNARQRHNTWDVEGGGDVWRLRGSTCRNVFGAVRILPTGCTRWRSQILRCPACTVACTDTNDYFYHQSMCWFMFGLNLQTFPLQLVIHEDLLFFVLCDCKLNVSWFWATKPPITRWFIGLLPKLLARFSFVGWKED